MRSWAYIPRHRPGSALLDRGKQGTCVCFSDLQSTILAMLPAYDAAHLREPSDSSMICSHHMMQPISKSLLTPGAAVACFAGHQKHMKRENPMAPSVITLLRPTDPSVRPHGRQGWPRQGRLA